MRPCLAKALIAMLQDLVLPFKASAEIGWHHPLAQAEDPAARRLIATCHLGTVRVQPTLGHVPLLRALHQQLRAGIDTFKPVSSSLWNRNKNLFSHCPLQHGIP